jgi:hypothetical protein
MTEKAMGNPPLPSALFETTRVKPGAIVYQFPDRDLPPQDAPENWLAARYYLSLPLSASLCPSLPSPDSLFSPSLCPSPLLLPSLSPLPSCPSLCRAATYKVVQFERSIDGTAVRLIPWPSPETKRSNGLPYDSRPSVPITVPLQEVSLIEQNRGKAGALNVYKDFLRTKGTQWAAEAGLNGAPIQIFMAIIDARHMLAEPEIFWNDGLPFFARMRSGASAKDYGEEHCGQQCIMVQYPQFFTNVTRDDFLDNKNSAYYTIWQTLRDCAKTITSSGTNAIWYCAFSSLPLPFSILCLPVSTSASVLPVSLSLYLCSLLPLPFAFSFPPPPSLFSLNSTDLTPPSLPPSLLVCAV